MAIEVRGVLVHYPGVAEHLLVMGPNGEHGFDLMDRICHVLADTGRDPAEVAATYTWLMVTVAAYTARHTRAAAVAAAAGTDRPGLLDIFGARTAPFEHRFPHLSAAAAAFPTDPEASYRDAIGHVIAQITRR